jgi:hypothetical protein
MVSNETIWAQGLGPPSACHRGSTWPLSPEEEPDFDNQAVTMKEKKAAAPAE